MAEVSNELLLEVMKDVQSSNLLIEGQREIRGELDAMRARLQALHVDNGATQADVKNIYLTIVGLDKRLERIETRLDIIEEPAD